MKNRILVLGATGNIGSQIVRILKEKKADFIGGVPAPELPKLEEMGVKGVAVDFDDPLSLEGAMQGADCLFMLLPLEEPMTRWAINILGAAKRTDISFIVRSSIIDAGSSSAYALYRVHGQIDDLVRLSGIPHSIVHPNSFMQNYMVYYRDSIVEKNALYFAYGDARLSSVDVRNIAAVDAEILLHPQKYQSREFNLTGPEALTQYEIASILSEVTGRRITYHPLRPEQFERNLRDAGLSEWDVDISMSLQRHIYEGRSAAVTADVHKVLGRPPTDFRTFARDYAEVWEAVPVFV